MPLSWLWVSLNFVNVDAIKAGSALLASRIESYWEMSGTYLSELFTALKAPWDFIKAPQELHKFEGKFVTRTKRKDVKNLNPFRIVNWRTSHSAAFSKPQLLRDFWTSPQWPLHKSQSIHSAKHRWKLAARREKSSASFFCLFHQAEDQLDRAQ